MADIIGSDNKEMPLYLIQIQYLDEQLERCQLKCDELEKQNNDLVSQYSTLEKDKKDTTEHLKHSLVAKEKKVDELTQWLESQQQAVKQHRKAMKLQHSQQIQQLQEQISKLNSESKMQVAKFKELQGQKEQLMQQLSDMESLKKQLVIQKEEHEAAIHSLKKEAELEMIKEFENKQNAVDDCIRMMTSNILQKERAQHGEQSEQLSFLLSENVALQKDKDALQARESELLVEMDNLNKDLSRITKESFTCKKEVEQLTKKCQQLDVKLKDSSINHQHMLAVEETLRQRLASVSKECRQKTAEVGPLRAELEKERSRRKQLDSVMQEATVILRNILEDSEKRSESRWKMQRLLEVLESTALKDNSENSGRGEKPMACGRKPARAETLNAATDPLFLMARYRPGDLGLVPQSMWKHKLAISRTDALSTSTQLPLNRKLCSQKTSSFVEPTDQSDPGTQQADSEAGASTSAEY